MQRHRRSGPGLVEVGLILFTLACVALIVLSLLAGCGATAVRGTVSHRQHSDGYSWVTHPCISTVKTRIRSGNTYVTSSTCVAYGTRVWHRPPSWQLCIDGTDTKGNPASSCNDVPENEFSRYHEGDQYP